MRPVNLIPREERRGATAPMRTGPLPYLLVGVLALALVGVALLVLAGNQVTERKAEVAQLKREDAAAQAQAEELSSYTQFQTLQQQREMTVGSLADSRFDWERVMRELSLILPDDAWLVNVTASASPNAGSGEGGEGGGGTLRGSAAGPALEIQGCAAGQEAVAGFVTALKDIDGVTRVGVESSDLGEETSASATGSGEAAAGGGNTDCQTREFIAQFSLVVAFDAAPVPVTATTAEPATAAAPEETEPTEEEEEG
ncbi:MAG TPA: PilN domain-containing protein [Solirubrobacterales bacterium]|nr:PilN domain-containing protein [Solirubrobacterales bacterium]